MVVHVSFNTSTSKLITAYINLLFRSINVVRSTAYLGASQKLTTTTLSAEQADNLRRPMYKKVGISFTYISGKVEEEFKVIYFIGVIS